MILKIEDNTIFAHCCVCNDWRIVDKQTYWLGSELRCLNDDAENNCGHKLGIEDDFRVIVNKFGEALQSPSIMRINANQS